MGRGRPPRPARIPGRENKALADQFNPYLAAAARLEPGSRARHRGRTVAGRPADVRAANAVAANHIAAI